MKLLKRTKLVKWAALAVNNHLNYRLPFSPCRMDKPIADQVRPSISKEFDSLGMIKPGTIKLPPINKEEPLLTITPALSKSITTQAWHMTIRQRTTSIQSSITSRSNTQLITPEIRAPLETPNPVMQTNNCGVT